MLNRIKSGEILISDGAMGTMLFERGLKSGGCPESFNMENPHVLEEIARLYREAGADIIHTNTFGASPLKLTHYHLDEQAGAINVAAVKSARSGAGRDAIISLSVGPSGQLLKPYGTVDLETMYDNFLVQIKAGLAAGADAVTIETMSDINEATSAIKAAKAIRPGIPVIATMTFEKGPRGFFTNMGVNVSTACARLAQAGADVIGANCGNGTEIMVELAREFRRNTELPLAIQSNAGLPMLKNGEVLYPESPEFMANQAQRLREYGVAIVGGCCGTTPEHIRAIKSAFR